MGGPQGLARQGWAPKTLTPGMKIQTVIHPLRDGTNGGQFMAVTLPDGTKFGNVNAPAGANAGAGPGKRRSGPIVAAAGVTKRVAPRPSRPAARRDD